MCFCACVRACVQIRRGEDEESEGDARGLGVRLWVSCDDVLSSDSVSMLFNFLMHAFCNFCVKHVSMLPLLRLCFLQNPKRGSMSMRLAAGRFGPAMIKGIGMPACDWVC